MFQSRVKTVAGLYNLFLKIDPFQSVQFSRRGISKMKKKKKSYSGCRGTNNIKKSSEFEPTVTKPLQALNKCQDIQDNRFK